MALSASGTVTFNGADTDYGSKASGLHLDVEYSIVPITGTTSYRVTLNLKHYNTWSMNWEQGASYLKVQINEKSSTQNVNVPLTGTSSSSTAGPFTFDIDLGVGNNQPVRMYVYLDYTRTACGICDKYGVMNYVGPGSNSNHPAYASATTGHYKGIGGWFSDTVDVEPTIVKPTIGSLVNSNKYNNKDGVSASTNSISVSWSKTAGDNITSSEYSLNGGAWTATTNTTSHTFSNLSSGTSYTIKVRSKNAAGTSNELSTTIRTKYDQSNFTTGITASDIGLEHINFNATVKHGTTNAISSGTWSIDSILTDQTLIVSSNAGSGQTGYKLVANTKYKISVSATLTSTYDDIVCTFDAEFTTDAKCSFSDTLGNFNFCYASEVAANYKITNPSGNAVRCSLIVANTTILTRDKSSSWDSSVDLQLTDAEWDAIYKKLGNNNSVAYTFRVGTYSNKDSNYATYITDSTGTITLAGKKLTGHIGASNVPRRAQALIGVSDVPRKAVLWIGDANNKPRRCI